ncbi:MAG: hypothetical protein QM739_02130 [Propionivibrio sp.]
MVSSAVWRSLRGPRGSTWMKPSFFLPIESNEQHAARFAGERDDVVAEFGDRRVVLVEVGDEGVAAAVDAPDQFVERIRCDFKAVFDHCVVSRIS